MRSFTKIFKLSLLPRFRTSFWSWNTPRTISTLHPFSRITWTSNPADNLSLTTGVASRRKALGIKTQEHNLVAQTNKPTVQQGTLKKFSILDIFTRAFYKTGLNNTSKLLGSQNKVYNPYALFAQIRLEQQAEIVPSIPCEPLAYKALTIHYNTSDSAPHPEPENDYRPNLTLPESCVPGLVHRQTEEARPFFIRTNPKNCASTPNVLSGEISSEQPTPSSSSTNTARFEPINETPDNPQLMWLNKLIDTLIENILTRNNARKTHRHNIWKVGLLYEIAMNINNPKQELDFNSTLDKIRTVCTMKRNALHFWAEPHSVAEFDEQIASCPLPSYSY